jgi:glutamate-1-semialdehyde 2,1-aminomutase
MEDQLKIIGVVSVATLSMIVLRKIVHRLALSRAKHPSLTGHSKMAKRVARMLPGYAYDEAYFFASDNAPADIIQHRRAGLGKLAQLYATRFPKSLAMTVEAAENISDLQFTSHYRVPYQYSAYLRGQLKTASFIAATDGVTMTDLDGNVFYDLTGSYGVNVFGLNFYKTCIAEGSARVAEIGPVLGVYHPCVLSNVKKICEISGMEEVSFHMSGTEAVMQAVRLARYHTKKNHLVRFCGAYHGWWEDVQPGIGNPVAPRDTYTLKEMHDDTLHVLRTRRDIACVLVNPLQALHPNKNAPGDSSLVDSARQAGFNRAAYSAWLKSLREVCSARGIVLIFDEVFVGFRLGVGGAQEYFGVKADMVTYGKTLGGGFPVGVVCGKREWMRRFTPARPADICFARGTFNSHPYVMAAMQVFLERLETSDIKKIYADCETVWNSRAELLNSQLQSLGLPIVIANMSSIWTVSYTRASRYNWMFQYYLRAEGLALSWVGTGRFIFSLNYSDADFAEVCSRFINAAHKMQADGWWWQDATLTNKAIKRSILKEMLSIKFGLRHG